MLADMRDRQKQGEVFLNSLAELGKVKNASKGKASSPAQV